MSRVGSSRTRDFVELMLGYGTIVGVIWTPEHWQHILTPIALVLTLGVVVARGQSREELGLGWRGLLASAWILPAGHRTRRSERVCGGEDGHAASAV
jgi:hypothetical protein